MGFSLLIWGTVLSFHFVKKHFHSIDYLKGRNFRGKKILRISRFLLKSAKLNSREKFQHRASAKLNSSEIFQNWASAKLKVINVNMEIPLRYFFEVCLFFLLISLCYIFNKNHLDTNTIIQQTKSPKKSKNFAIRKIKFPRKLTKFFIREIKLPRKFLPLR